MKVVSSASLVVYLHFPYGSAIDNGAYHDFETCARNRALRGLKRERNPKSFIMNAGKVGS